MANKQFMEFVDCTRLIAVVVTFIRKKNNSIPKDCQGACIKATHALKQLEEELNRKIGKKSIHLKIDQFCCCVLSLHYYESKYFVSRQFNSIVSLKYLKNPIECLVPFQLMRISSFIYQLIFYLVISYNRFNSFISSRITCYNTWAHTLNVSLSLARHFALYRSKIEFLLHR